LKNIPLKTNEDNKLIKALKKGVKNSGLKDTEVTSFRGWSDAALFVNELNIPSVVFGPGLPEQCHAADESLEIEQLKKAVKVYLSLIIELCY
jgi:acetylornithine deacetylase/succinyl-diaminopimelate desuccinylase-like protein